MVFKSGFSLKNEELFFKEYIKDSKYTVCGFSYGAIKALKHVREQLMASKRVDTMQLFSPAFFQSFDKKFKKLQLRGYIKDKEKYLHNFTELCFSPYEKKIIEHCETDISELEELLYYEWDIDELREIAAENVKIEVYLGAEDKIIDASSAREFFKQVATVTYIKDANHFLQIN